MPCNCGGDQSCFTYRLRDPADGHCGCTGGGNTTVIYSTINENGGPAALYGRVISGTGQSYVVNIYGDGPSQPATLEATVSCPDLSTGYQLQPGYPLIVVPLSNGDYISLPSLIFNNSSLPFQITQS